MGTAAAIEWPLTGISRANSLESSSAEQADGLIRLSSNENPYGPSAKVSDAVKSAIGEANRYPRTKCNSLVEQIAALHHVRPEQVLLGCGSTEIFRMAAFAFLGSGKQLIHASPTFGAMEHYAQFVGSQTIPVPLTPAFAHDVNGIVTRATGSTTLVYLQSE